MIGQDMHVRPNALSCACAPLACAYADAQAGDRAGRAMRRKVAYNIISTV